MMRRLLRPLLLAASALLALAACESAPVTGRSQIMLVSESEERQMGLQAYQQVLATEHVSHNAQVNALVEKVGRRIADAAEHPPREMWHAPRFRWEFRTVDKNEPNAFCLPGGKVVVWQNHGDYKLEDFVARAGDGWHRSTWDERTPIHVGANKVHLKVKFSRWRKDGSLLATFETIYIVTLQDGHWGIQARSSFAS